ncbi:unnamed protein product [Gongylonema pulchrum]|uniref:C2 DOCK-type domain-containing protein n=1 Tax=Gongylonema pulchrum TaxID=637853 RepID=A0A183E0W1_9BILA|nr:unnamed protein product [Gongylonema pulchrum]
MANQKSRISHAIYNRFASPVPFVNSVRCSVQHHEQNPVFNEENNESPVGYAWLPLLKNDRLIIENDEQELALSVAADLPPGYINYQLLGFGKGVIFPFF